MLQASMLEYIGNPCTTEAGKGEAESQIKKERKRKGKETFLTYKYYF